jgi:hypothetical protein
MAQQILFNPSHTDMELLRLRLTLTPGQRLQAMFDARFLLVGMIRGRLRQQYPELSDVELNLKVLEEIERVQNAKFRPQLIP